MSARHSLLRLAVSLLVTLPAACTDPERITWTEDAVLPDQRTITLNRYQEFSGSPHLFQQATPAGYGLDFENPATGERVTWSHEGDLMPIAIWIDRDAAVLLTVPVSGGLFRYECPDPPYLAFRRAGKQWTPLPLQQLTRRVIAPNLTGIASLREAESFERQRHLAPPDVDRALPDAYRGKVVDLTGVEEQTFGSHCVPPFNTLLRESKR